MRLGSALGKRPRAVGEGLRASGQGRRSGIRLIRALRVGFDAIGQLMASVRQLRHGGIGLLEPFGELLRAVRELFPRFLQRAHDLV